MIRTFTNSEYDHVAMVLKYATNPDEVYFVEAVGKYGVYMNKWSTIKKHIGTEKFYGKLMLRQVKKEDSFANDTKLLTLL